MFGRNPSPLSKDRCDQLELARPPDYSARADNELKLEMRARGLEMRGRRNTAHWVKALEASDKRDLKRYQDWSERDEFDKKIDCKYELPLKGNHVTEKQEVKLKALMDTPQDRMFASQYEEDPSRKTFLELPGEIRNAIYNMAIFNFNPPNLSVSKFQVLVDERQLLM
ncbi:hypothetical protein CC86DRAFT_412558 [Ophiobolus disseminans]|uniref:Uncharacterized protein n=1 Tax=Ophiobolus disseminans TaxID=1469910 RepID=A0A6A6ZH87_9PLEO|nr:hypothetical protein CC86DRAFT_412558 [Ophiobolus disseminans]